MFNFTTNRKDIENELCDEVRLFFPYEDECDELIEHKQSFNATADGTISENVVTMSLKTYTFTDHIKAEPASLEYKRLDKRACKLAVFKALSDFSGRRPPWGSLTGIRPSRLVYDMLAEGVNFPDCSEELSKRFMVGNEKSKLICEIVKNQCGYYQRNDKLFNLYVHIPFCNTKCSYCSFTTELTSRCRKVIPTYVHLLREEIKRSVEFINDHGKIFSVYVGGGTPTTLSADELRSLFDGFAFGGAEFTVEAGRPDTITWEKLDAIKDIGATRICVNPQTLNDETLVKIGRAHTSADFYDKYELAKSFDFNINIDLIAGLTDERLDDFKRSVNGVAALDPDNVTVHTLSRKNGSAIKLGGKYYNDDVDAMTQYAYDRLTSVGYVPYYLYRQKHMLGNLENIGYCRAGKQCANNVTTMEDCMSVIACGAGAITKVVHCTENRIERLANLRDVRLYIEQFDKKMHEKEIFLEKQFTKNE